MTGRDEVLLWLNDRCGLKVWAEITAIGEGDSHAILVAEGRLRHWLHPEAGRPDEFNAGHYFLDRNDLALHLPAETKILDLNALTIQIELAPDVQLVIVVDEEDDALPAWLYIAALPERSRDFRRPGGIPSSSPAADEHAARESEDGT